MATPKKSSAFIFNLTKGKKKTFEITFDQMATQIANLPEYVRLASLNFTVDLSRKARDVFQERFDKNYQGFHDRWAKLADATVRKRKWMMNKFPSFTEGASEKILTNFGTLRRSIKINDSLGYNTPTRTMRRVYTDPREFANSPIHKGFNYAGIMQTGRPAGNGRVKAIPARPFMGHHRFIDEWSEERIDKYLLRSVFTETGGFGMKGDLPFNIKK